MADTFSQILNWAIPIGAIIFIAAALFGKVKEPMVAFFGWIKNLLGLGVEKIKEADVPRVPSLDGSIVYRG